LLTGRRLGLHIGSVATYLAAGLLMIIGMLTIREALGEEDDVQDAGAGSFSGRALLMTGISIGLDEVAVGISMGVLVVAVEPALS
jgi:putative Mn2+ efflux pump MntP